MPQLMHFLHVNSQQIQIYPSFLPSLPPSFLPSLLLSLPQGNFGGRCMLYGLVSYNDTAQLIKVDSSSSSSLCYFVSAISVMVAVVCFSLSVYGVYTFCSDGEIKR